MWKVKVELFTSTDGSWFRYHLIHHLWLDLCRSTTQHCIMLHPSSLKMGPFPFWRRCQKPYKAPHTQFGFLLLRLPIAVSRRQPCPARGHLEMPSVPRSSRCGKQIGESISVIPYALISFHCLSINYLFNVHLSSNDLTNKITSI